MSLSDSFTTPKPRLATITPETDHRDRLTFACDCGFDFTQLAPAVGEHGL